MARILFLTAQAWSVGLLALRAFLFRQPPPPPAPDLRTPAITTIVMAGDEPDGPVLTAVAVAQAVGPVVLVDTTGLDRTVLAASLGVTYVDPTAADPLAVAFGLVETDAVLPIRPRAAVHTAEAGRAASRLGSGVCWVTGRSRAFNADAFDPMAKRPLAGRLRAGARRHGAAIWETDATIIDTAAARAVGGLRADTAMDELLRAMAAAGGTGAVHDADVVRFSAPASAPGYWSEAVAQRRESLRASVRGVRVGAGRARVASLALAAQILGGIGFILWLLTGAVLAAEGRSPVDATAAIGVSLGAVAAARVALRIAQSGTDAPPSRVAVAAVYDAVAGLASLFRRSAPRRGGGAAGSFLLLAEVALLAETLFAFALGLRDGGPAVRWAVVGVCVLWAAVVGAALSRARGMATAARTSFRFPVQMTAEIDERVGRTVDVSPGGIRLRGLPGVPEVGKPLTGTVWSPQGEVVYFSGRVAHATGSGKEAEVGIALDLPPAALAAWTRVIFAAAGITAKGQ